MLTLHDVTDIRTGRFYHTAVVSERNAKWFVTVESDQQNESDDVSVPKEA